MTPEQHANWKRDARLRNEILQMLDRSKQNHCGGWLTLPFIFDVLQGFGISDQQVSDIDHALGLCRDLVTLGYIQEEDNREDRDQDFKQHLTFKLTRDGVRFINRELPATRMIDDGRIVKGAMG